MATVGLFGITVKSGGTVVGTGVDTLNFTNAAVTQVGNATTIDVSNAGGFIDGAGTATKLPLFSDSNTLADSALTQTTVLTSTVPYVAPATTASLPSLRLPHGTAPSSPTNGDVWTTTLGFFTRINGATLGPAPLPRVAAGVPTGAPVAGENGMALDTTAVTGGLYAWNGAAWVKGSVIP